MDINPEGKKTAKRYARPLPSCERSHRQARCNAGGHGRGSNLLAAGVNTTSAAIKAVMAYIIHDKTRYKRLQSELDEVASRVSG